MSTFDFLFYLVATLIIGFIILKALTAFTNRLLSSGQGRKAPHKPLVLILGPSNSGKSLLFYRLLGDNNVNTVSSLRLNSIALRDMPATSPLGEGTAKEHVAAADLLDFPGHPRLAPQLIQLLPRAVAVIYVFDSSDKAMIKQGSEQLYDLWLHSDICQNEVPFLLVCNKSDLPSAKTQTGVMSDVLREIERLRVSRSAVLEGEDEANRYLGVEGRVFRLEDAPVPISVCSASVMNNEFQSVIDFLLAKKV